MWKEKLLHILWYVFIFSPLTFFNGLSIILLANDKIVTQVFHVTKFRKRKREIDKKKFEKMMKRITK